MFCPALISRKAVSPSSDADLAAFLEATGITDTTQVAALQQLVKDLKRYNLWNLLFAAYPFVGGDDTKHSYNLINPAQYQITWSGSITHDADGVTFDGLTGYGDTAFSPSVGGFTLASFHTSFYARAAGAAPSTYQLGCGDGANYIVNGKYIATHDAFFVDPSVNPTATYVADGLFTQENDGSASHRLYGGDGIEEVTNSSDITASTIPNLNVYLGCMNDTGTPSNFVNSNIAFASLGSSLNAVGGGPGKLRTSVQTFQTALSRQV